MKLTALSFEKVLLKENIKKSMETKCFISAYERDDYQEDGKKANHKFHNSQSTS